MTHLDEIAMKSIYQTLIPTAVDLNIMYPSAAQPVSREPMGGRPGGRVVAVDPWGPEWNVHTRVSGVFFFSPSAPSPGFFLPHTEDRGRLID